MNLQSDRLLLEEITKGDLPAIHELHSIPEVDEFNTLGIPKNVEETEKIHQGYFQDQKKEKRSMYCWAIKLKEDKTFIGLAGMSVSNDRFNMGEFYYKLFPKYWGNGYATETGKIIIQFGFNILKLHRIEAGVATENSRSVRVLEKLHMTREGIRRKILPIRGQWVDNFHYAIIEDDPGY